MVERIKTMVLYMNCKMLETIPIPLLETNLKSELRFENSSIEILKKIVNSLRSACHHSDCNRPHKNCPQLHAICNHNLDLDTSMIWNIGCDLDSLVNYMENHGESGINLLKEIKELIKYIIDKIDIYLGVFSRHFDKYEFIVLSIQCLINFFENFSCIFIEENIFK